MALTFWPELGPFGSPLPSATSSPAPPVFRPITRIKGEALAAIYIYIYKSFQPDSFAGIHSATPLASVKPLGQCCEHHAAPLI